MTLYVVDVEGDGLYPSKFYCMCIQEVGKENILTLSTHEDMIKWLSQDDIIIIGHNFARWDKVQLERVLGIKISARIIDSLFLSWYLFPDRLVHGLESFGVEYGVPKPVVDDWVGITDMEQGIIDYYENR